MCGFTGYLSDLIEPDETLISLMSNRLNSRGPDSEGIWTDKEDGFAVGHKRLSILDLSEAGYQPILSSDKRYVLAYNGEIYNHLELRKNLNFENHNWVGTSDSETLVECISEWGIEKTLKNINGMFAFSLWDRKKKELTLARDRMGEKPLYYGNLKNSFLFGSQLKSFIDFPGWEGAIDKTSLRFYFKYGYVPSPRSIFKNFNKLEPAHYITVKKRDSFVCRKFCYWDLKNKFVMSKSKDFNETYVGSEILEEKLKNSVKKRMISDVPIGAFLSGGLDSSIIVCLMQSQSKIPINTFTIGFENKNFDETLKSKNIANFIGSNHTEIILSSSDSYGIVETLSEVWDEPFADLSQIPTLLLSKITKNYVTVALSGDGGDELFCGYNRYLNGLDLYKFSKLKIPNFIFNKLKFKKLVSNLNNELLIEKYDKFFNVINTNNIYDYYSKVVSIFDEKDLIIKDKFSNNLELINDTFDENQFFDEEILMYLDMKQYLPEDIMTKVDRASMSFGLETRAPFLDHELLEYSLKIPLAQKKNHTKGKQIIREILNNYLPRPLVDKNKKGFSVPISDWLNGPLKEWSTNLLDKEINNNESLFDPSRIRMLMSKENNEFRKNQKIWTLLMFLSWKANFIK